jgi:hypothetical protein
MKQYISASIFIIIFISSLFAVPEIDKPAPDFTIYNLTTGDSTTLSDFRGEKVVLLISGNLC